ncbi:HAMP domain-containing sensor histidine kinase [Myxococcaceae bacterium GXIMD 01537]
MSLKGMLTASVIALATLALSAATALMLMTSFLHRTNVSMGASIEGIRLTEELEVDLLLHQRLSDQAPLPGSLAAYRLNQAERRLLAQLEVVHAQATSGLEAALLDDVERTLHAYLRARSPTPPLALPDLTEDADPTLSAALAAMERVVKYNVDEARTAEAEADRWDELANFLGIAMAVMLVVGVAALLIWLDRFAFRPAMGLSHAMRRFGAGSRRTRAAETGPTEVRDMARTFNEMAHSLARQRDSQLTFLAGIAHELRNPLSALKLSTALAAPGRGPPTPERMQRTLALVGRQVDRLDRMVGDLLDATRIEAGRLDLQFEERDARELVRAVVELYQSSEPGHVLRLFVPEDAVMVRCDPARMEQVLTNLVSNALKYSPSGSRVDVGVQSEGRDAVFAVTDQGIGISPEERRGLFAPFSRTGQARERAPGVGLGLSVTRRIVEAHGGHIEVDSEPGRGSTFRVRLALLPARPLPPEPRPEDGGVVH